MLNMNEMPCAANNKNRQMKNLQPSWKRKGT